MTVKPSKLINVFNWLSSFDFNNLPIFFQFIHNYFPHALQPFKKELKLFSSLRRKELDISFLETCIEERIIPSFIFKKKFHECLENEEVRKIQHKILRRMLEKEKQRRNEIIRLLTINRNLLNNVSGDFCYQLCISMSENSSNKAINDKISAQNKKLSNLRKLFGVFKFNVKNTVLNLSNIDLTDDELNILKYGPKHGIRKKINKFKLQSKVETLFNFLIMNVSKLNKSLDFENLEHVF